MKKLKTKILSIVLPSLLTGSLLAQNNTVTAGGEAQGNSGSVSYSIGQMVYHTVQSTYGSVSQGIQQAYTISDITGVNHIKLECTAYPNPTTDYLNLVVLNGSINGLAYQIVNLDGLLVKKANITNSETQISMSSNIAGTYILHVTEAGKSIKSFNIIKN